MSSVTVLNQSAEPVGNVDLDDQVFGVEVKYKKPGLPFQ